MVHFFRKSIDPMTITPNPAKALLLVEDHEPLRVALHDWLSFQLKGWVIYACGTAETALSMIANRPPDVVLMDIALPKMDGVTAVSKITREYPKVQCVIMTLHDSPEYRSAAHSAGAVGFVNKLYVQKDLLPLLELFREQTVAPRLV
jgi:two-component system response regulator FimZ (fimbrial Z protein)